MPAPARRFLQADLDVVLTATLYEGLAAAMADNAVDTTDRLLRVWNVVGGGPPRDRLVADHRLGPLLVRSEVELGRALMNRGVASWASAAVWFDRAIDDCMRLRPESPPLVGDGRMFSLSPDDILVEANQHLGIVLRDHPDEALARLYTAIERVSRLRARVTNPRLLQGNALRDRARLRLFRLESRKRASISQAREDVDLAGRYSDLGGDEAMWAASVVTSARLEHSAGDQSLARSLARDATPSVLMIESPVLRSNLLISIAQVIGLEGGVDQAAVARAAQDILKGGFSHEARKILGLRSIQSLLEADTLRRLLSLCEREPAAV